MNKVDLIPPQQRRLGRYSLLYRIASGGMANVYLARMAGTAGFEKLVAIKRVHEHLTEDEEFTKMLVDEARLVAKLTHPNVVSVLELGVAGHTHYMVMEYVHGESLLSLVRKQRPPVELCAKIIAQAAAGVHAAHQLRGRDGELYGVVHRDVSPGNILISYDGAVKVTDFGVAQAKGNLHVTAMGNVKGKVAYMAPEQARREPADHRIDIFALGIVLYEICTRRRLFKGKTEADTIAKLIALEVPRPSSRDKDFPPALERVILRALERDPDQRFQTAEEMQAALEAYLLEAGTTVLPKHIAELMTGIFGDRIQERDELLTRCLSEDLDDEDLLGLSDESSSGLLNGSAGSFSYHGLPDPLGQRRRRLQWGLIGLALVAALGGVIYAVTRKPPPPVRVLVSPKAPPVSISVRATPAHATVTLAGKPISNPFQAKHRPTRGQAELVVAAVGFKTQRMSVDLEQGGSFVIALERLVPLAPDGGPPAVDAKGTGKGTASHKRRKRRRKKKPKTPKDLFGNPFGK